MAEQPLTTQRIRALATDRRAIAIVLVLVFTVAAILFAVSRGGQSEAQQAQDAVQEGLKAQVSGNLAAARASYLRAIQLDPQNEFAYYNLGVISQNQGDLVGAESSYRNAISIDPNFVEALFNLAIIRADAGAPEEAITLYEHVIKVKPDDAEAHLNLGFLLIDQGSEARGRAELDEAVRLDPSLESRVPAESPSETPSP
jgi:Tfp pilus assembly protein PilF